MDLTEGEIQLFNDSLDLCVSGGRFLDLFYEKFIGSSPRIAAKFASTDMRRQKRALKASLYSTMLVADNNAAAIDHLLGLSARHVELGVEPEDYEEWLECQIAAMKACIEAPSDELERVWRQVLRIGIETLRDGKPPDPKRRLL